jgi:hypothetical protein
MKLILRYMGVPPLLDVQASGRATAYPTDQKVVQRDGGTAVISLRSSITTAGGNFGEPGSCGA